MICFSQCTGHGAAVQKWDVRITRGVSVMDNGERNGEMHKSLCGDGEAVTREGQRNRMRRQNSDVSMLERVKGEMVRLGVPLAVALVLLGWTGESSRAQAQMAADGTMWNVGKCALAIEGIVYAGGSGLALQAVQQVMAKVSMNATFSVGATGSISVTPLSTPGSFVASLTYLLPAERAVLLEVIKANMGTVVGAVSATALWAAAYSGEFFVRECWSVAKTYISSADAILRAVYPAVETCVANPPPMGYSGLTMMTSNYDNWVACQSTCGVSKSHVEQNSLWSLPKPPACTDDEVAALRSANIWSYGNYCLGVCKNGNTRPKNFSQCGYSMGIGNVAGYYGGNAAAWCADRKKALRVIAQSGITGT